MASGPLSVRSVHRRGLREHFVGSVHCSKAPWQRFEALLPEQPSMFCLTWGLNQEPSTRSQQTELPQP